MFFQDRLLFPTLIAFCLINFTFGATRLPDNEVQALKDIAKTMGKIDWDFNEDPCNNTGTWFKSADNAVTCNCSLFNGSVCHVVSIVLKKENLPGTLPPELVRLPSLQQIDLTKNYLNGTIPPEWGSMKLVNISLGGNRFTGSIPKELGNISTLTSFTADYNQLSGDLPPELGNLPLIERMLLTSNNLSGEVPVTLASLTTLKDFRISDNHFTGTIPNFIQNWKNLNRLAIQASGLIGPIPDGIAALENLKDLRITDLNGTEAPFPPLRSMKLETLILRSCNITGPLPEYLGEMIELMNLDLSFNKLSGEIPSTYTGLSAVDFIYFTGNLLTGQVPRWVLDRKGNIDITYNNFTTGSSNPSSCDDQTFGIVSCLRSLTCPRTFYKLHINCGGGEQVTINGNTTYEADTAATGPSSFWKSGTNWAVSSAGNFLDNNLITDTYILRNSSRLSMNDSQESKLYKEARLSGISLSYYGFCLGTGNYTVYLHFAEIKFTDDKTYSSLGRRFFDIYIQGKLEFKDFNIEDEAEGVGKAIKKKFTVAVTNKTLEIRLYWAGKGTDGIPDRGVYGPLISAISVDPADFVPPSEPGSSSSSSSSISVGTVVGIVAAAASVVSLVVGILWWKGCLQKKNTLEQDLRGLDLQTGSFTLRQIKAATNNFDPANKIGEGGFGPVYKGLLADGTIIAVKQLSSKSKQGNREFVNEIGMISALQHPQLVKLYGCCIEGNQLLLIYEYLANNSLARALFGPEEHQLKLDWSTRHKICVGIARGLAYLHEESRLKIVHRDIKATNVLLDEDLNPKISDFGLAKLDEEDNTHISTRIAGTYGYMAPEYAMRGYLTDKADVYSFGIVALEIVCGRSNTSYRPTEERFYLLDLAHVLKAEGNLMELVDPRLGSDFNKEEVMVMFNVALLCTNVSAAVRPSMSSVVSMLEGRIAVQDFVPDSSFSNHEASVEAMKKHYHLIEENISDESQTRSLMSESKTNSMSTISPWTASSSSAADLYPVN